MADLPRRSHKPTEQLESELSQYGIRRQWLRSVGAVRWVCSFCTGVFSDSREAGDHVGACPNPRSLERSGHTGPPRDGDTDMANACGAGHPAPAPIQPIVRAAPPEVVAAIAAGLVQVHASCSSYFLQLVAVIASSPTSGRVVHLV